MMPGSRNSSTYFIELTVPIREGVTADLFDSQLILTHCLQHSQLVAGLLLVDFTEREPDVNEDPIARADFAGIEQPDVDVALYATHLNAGEKRLFA
jgi:hypothetical protein